MIMITTILVRIRKIDSDDDVDSDDVLDAGICGVDADRSRFGLLMRMLTVVAKCAADDRYDAATICVDDADDDFGIGG